MFNKLIENLKNLFGLSSKVINNMAMDKCCSYKNCGLIKVIENRNAYQTADKFYNSVTLLSPDGISKRYLFTDEQLSVAEFRANKNPEDFPN